MQPACVALDKLHSPTMSQIERNGKLFLSILYMEDSGKVWHKSELTWIHMIIIKEVHLWWKPSPLRKIQTVSDECNVSMCLWA